MILFVILFFQLIIFKHFIYFHVHGMKLQLLSLTFLLKKNVLSINCKNPFKATITFLMPDDGSSISHCYISSRQDILYSVNSFLLLSKVSEISFGFKPFFHSISGFQSRRQHLCLEERGQGTVRLPGSQDVPGSPLQLVLWPVSCQECLEVGALETG